LKKIFIFISFLTCFGWNSFGQSFNPKGIIAHWSFNSPSNFLVFEKKSREQDTIMGYSKLVEGVNGNCLKLDGYTSKIVHEDFRLNSSSGGFSIEAWVALQSLPWNWSAIVNQDLDISELEILSYQLKHNFFFGVNAAGQLGFHLNSGGQMIECLSSNKLSLLHWNHVAATYNGTDLMCIYINGELVGEQKLIGNFNAKCSADLWLGMNFEKLGPVGSERKASENILSDMVIHGLLDEIKIYNFDLTANQIETDYESKKPDIIQPLKWEKLPSGPDNLEGKFNAIYTRLNFTEEWENSWRVGDTPDILITFDNLPVRFLFWRGTGYGGAWITENGIWMGDQSLERAGKGKSPLGCSEHMSDKQARYSQVRIIKRNDARIVVHWRYAVSDIFYNIFGASKTTDWGEWAEEYYYIYPDGVSTRHQMLWTNNLSHEWQETIVINQAGTFPEDNIETKAITLGNMDGEFVTYSWENGAPAKFETPENIMIQKVNLKSKYKPFIIFEPGANVKPFKGAIRKEYSKFPWWNHWPVAQLPNDGRKAFGPDRPSHSSLAQAIEGSKVIHSNNNGTYSVVTLTGLTDKPNDYLADLANSWNKPARFEMETQDFKFVKYSKFQKSYILERISGSAKNLTFSVIPSNTSPVLNPCFVIENWGTSDPVLSVNKKQMTQGNDFRIGFEETLEGTNLIIWLSFKSKEITQINIEARNVEP
jgi:hypothetical protein